MFQKFDISPVIVRVDYSPCHVDLAALRGGKYVELVNLVPWKVIISFIILIFKREEVELTFRLPELYVVL